ncbi:peptidoglycan DD-metalloendopeptidase family protein [Aquincola sp. S2]|uniref:Peptidoglycan DD-metalloendopeptidase family protein n=1 Tax=Pseudaquabacterium terrae TaxID=2732868 RepID=A0ABX2EMP6_9BURK|nr:peptidoglycan DD-metalloendopeptidase family protein [Aquabacterium terrae]NRF69960.1 peptidoglycan DD-metalloendopeptidase family protein [Aquabacterium terrae]
MFDRLPLLSVLLVLLMAGCASSRNKAPVEDRVGTPRVAAAASAPAAVASAVAADAKPLPNAENAGKPGYYTVRPGDTLIRIGLENGQNWRDVARWNGIENANLIEVGQVLRVLPPSVDPNAVAARGVAGSRVEARPLDAKLPATAASAPGAVPATPGAAPAAAASGPAPTPAPPKDPEDDLNWLWPAGGQVATPFEEGRSKGLAITGKAGDPVLAAADGRVVYAGSGLRGYGNLVIVKHNNTYLTAYAHNQTLLVKEDQVVRRGQRIAEMGSSDAERVQLHFEIRKQGKPIDPARLLPPR